MIEFRPADMRVCYGWAYEPCGAAARFVVHEEEIDSLHWRQYGVCLAHARVIIDAVGSETAKYVRTWIAVEDWKEGWCA